MYQKYHRGKLSEYTDIFTVLVCTTEYIHRIMINPNHRTVVYVICKVPITIRLKVKDELERMEHLEVIESVHESTDWVNSMATDEKQPDATHMHSRMPNDSQSWMPAFWQVKLDHESAKLCTLIDHSEGTCSNDFNLVPHLLEGVLHAVIFEIFVGIEGVELIVDDLLVWGESEELHDVLQCTQQCNLKLNMEKSQMMLKQISYIDHILGKDGLKPDFQKVKAIVNIICHWTKKNFKIPGSYKR